METCKVKGYYKWSWSFRSRGKMCKDLTFFEFLSDHLPIYLPYPLLTQGGEIFAKCEEIFLKN
jgi:hypothetical protein